MTGKVVSIPGLHILPQQPLQVPEPLLNQTVQPGCFWTHASSLSYFATISTVHSGKRDEQFPVWVVGSHARQQTLAKTSPSGGAATQNHFRIAVISEMLTRQYWMEKRQDAILQVWPDFTYVHWVSLEVNKKAKCGVVRNTEQVLEPVCLGSNLAYHSHLSVWPPASQNLSMPLFSHL